MKKILALLLLSSLTVSGIALAVQARYERVEVAGEVTVMDKITGLEWMQDTGATTRWWIGALAYCEDLNHAGNTDWRLPNVTELASIIDEKQPVGQPPINQSYFTDFIPGTYWSSTTKAKASNPDNAFVVYFDGSPDAEYRWGGIFLQAKSDPVCYVMCVREFR